MAKKKTAPAKPATKSKTVDGAHVRMYRIGTGDCFVVKFLAGKTETFKMMIDCGAWQGSKEVFTEHVTDLKKYVGDGVDVLVVTHEHKDHVLGFELCEKLFTKDFKVGETWMSWAEEDGAPAVEKLKKEHGAKKKALAAAGGLMARAVNDPAFHRDQNERHMGGQLLKAQERFAASVSGFVDLHMDADLAAAGGEYIGPLKGMAVVKDQIAAKGIRHFKPGDIIDDMPGLKGVRIYVLGPPKSWESIKKEDSAEEGETYDHNKELAGSDAFAAAVNAFSGNGGAGGTLPFDRSFETDMTAAHPYENEADAWRRIDNDWLMSAGSLALRLNTGINNLSLALAIEFIESGRVMLFPGDAEYGSWATWHDIPWKTKGRGKNDDGSPKHLTEDLLNRTVFYKVAHHLSHNGTAKRKGLEMMTHDDLAAMATLDYSVISKDWKNTMPNQGIISDLLNQTKGRLMVMNTKDLFADAKKTRELAPEIEKARRRMSAAEKKEFEAAHDESDLWIDYRVKG
ncbi:MAG: hypothetical protein K1X78_22650 [Verrucomicrobiaceae bacterium]|nr:hypothetical protein [Verrucomicrobiaceae bacterium]